MKRLALFGTLLTCLVPVGVRALAPSGGGPPPGGGPPKLDPRMPDLFLAAGRDDAAAVKALVAGGLDPDVRNILQMTPLIYAASINRPAAVRALLASGAKVNADSPMGSALTMAETEGHEPIALLLLENGAAPEAPRLDSIQPLMLAAWHGHAEVVRRLLADGAKVDARNNDGATALTYAARGGSRETTQLLLEKGAAVDAVDSRGWTPLMYAATNGRVAAARTLLGKGASTAAREKGGRTALLLAAAYSGDPETVRCLLDAGADVKATDDHNRTAAAVAAMRRSAAAPLLAERTPQFNGRTALPRTPREAASTGLSLVQVSQGVFLKKLGCMSCHHQSLGMMTTAVAQECGYPIDAKLLKSQLERTRQGVDGFAPFYHRAIARAELTKQIPFTEIGEASPGEGYILAALAALKAPPTPAVTATTTLLARRQDADGGWGYSMARVPIQSSEATVTALAVRALQAYPPKEGATETKRRITRAKVRLLGASAKTSEDRAFRLLGLKWAGASAAELRSAVETVRGDQHPDGGWGQLDSMPSDAYATGQALYALNAAGGVPFKDAALRRGVSFLCRTQDDDGSWFVNKRAAPLNFYTDVGFPHGESQYVSFAGTCWATMALMKASASKPD